MVLFCCLSKFETKVARPHYKNTRVHVQAAGQLRRPGPTIGLESDLLMAGALFRKLCAGPLFRFSICLSGPVYLAYPYSRSKNL
jgi:hypothetical protein